MINATIRYTKLNDPEIANKLLHMFNDAQKKWAKIRTPHTYVRIQSRRRK